MALFSLIMVGVMLGLAVTTNEADKKVAFFVVFALSLVSFIILSAICVWTIWIRSEASSPSSTNNKKSNTSNTQNVNQPRVTPPPSMDYRQQTIIDPLNHIQLQVQNTNEY
jgi:hypothetical protein